jgi:hypothetical protein
MQPFEARRALNRSQETRAQFWHVTIVTGFFVVVFGATVFLGTVMVVGTFGGDPSNELTANGRAGRVARTLRDGTLCHFMIFDNKTAQTKIASADAMKTSPSRNRNDPRRSPGANSPHRLTDWLKD